MVSKDFSYEIVMGRSTKSRKKGGFMPAEVVIVRHGECIGNAAYRASCKGDCSLFNKEVLCQESSQWRLTSTGIKQPELAGEWIRNNISQSFDCYFTSDYVRAIETAEHLGFKNSNWKENILLRERNWGGFEYLTFPERNELFKRLGIPPKENSLLWHTPGGETMLSLVEKMKLFLNELKSQASNKRVLVVSHGGPLQALRVLQHKIEEPNYETFVGGTNYIRNCHIFHFSSKKNCGADIPLYSLERSAHLNPDGQWIEVVQNI